MPTPTVTSAGVLASILHALRENRQSGGNWTLFQRTRVRNGGKTCAHGMGGRRGGMVSDERNSP